MIYYSQKEFTDWSRIKESVIQKMQNSRGMAKNIFSYVIGQVIFKNLADLEACYETWLSFIPYIINLFLKTE